LLKMNGVIAPVGVLSPWNQSVLPPAHRRTVAVSPAARDAARRSPVTSALLELPRTMRSVTRWRGKPSASAA